MRLALLVAFVLAAHGHSSMEQAHATVPHCRKHVLRGHELSGLYLINTPAGDILINPDYEESVPLIKQSVEKLGFQFSDIKIILISHAHDDHAAGCALAKELSGAKLMFMDADVPLIKRGGEGDFQYSSLFPKMQMARSEENSCEPV